MSFAAKAHKTTLYFNTENIISHIQHLNLVHEDNTRINLSSQTAIDSSELGAI